jgi:hypothetical protein
MIIREMKWADKPEVDRIYDLHWNHNEYPDFMDRSKFPCSFVVTSGDSIILAGGVKTIAEAIVVTDKGFSVRDRQEALLQALGSTIFLAQGMKYGQMHAFVHNDENYVNHLQKYGFKLIDAKLLVLDFGESHGKA